MGIDLNPTANAADLAERQIVRALIGCPAGGDVPPEGGTLERLVIHVEEAVRILFRRRPDAVDELASSEARTAAAAAISGDTAGRDLAGERVQESLLPVGSGQAGRPSPTSGGRVIEAVGLRRYCAWWPARSS